MKISRSMGKWSFLGLWLVLSVGGPLAGAGPGFFPAALAEEPDQHSDGQVKDDCSQAFAPFIRGIPVRAISPEFLEKHTTKMTREVPDQSAVSNQRCLGVCHLYALYSDMQQELPDSKGRDSLITPLPWIYEHWKNQALAVATDFTPETDVSEGARSILESMDSIKKAGAMPRSVWKAAGGREDIADQMRKMVESRILENRIAALKLERDRLLKLVENRSEEINSPEAQRLRSKGRIPPDALINAKAVSEGEVRGALNNKRALLKSGGTRLTEKQLELLETAAKQVNVGRKISPDEYDAIQAALQADIRSEVTKIFNRIFFDDPNRGPPQSFVWKDKEYTPQSFANTFMPSINQKVVTMLVTDEKVGRPKFLGDTILGHYTLETPRKTFEEWMKKTINAGNNIWLGYDHDRFFVDDKTGIMSIKAYQGASEGYLSRAKRKMFQKSYGMHAVQVVGYEADADGKVIKWKIKNSWGSKAGDKGYFYMYDDYFRAYASMASFRDEAGELDSLNQVTSPKRR
jgi:hypothetical protein